MEHFLDKLGDGIFKAAQYLLVISYYVVIYEIFKRFTYEHEYSKTSDFYDALFTYLTAVIISVIISVIMFFLFRNNNNNIDPIELSITMFVLTLVITCFAARKGKLQRDIEKYYS